MKVLLKEDIQEQMKWFLKLFDPRISSIILSCNLQSSTHPNKMDKTGEIQVNKKEKECRIRFTEMDYQNRLYSKEFYLMDINENQNNSTLKIIDQKA